MPQESAGPKQTAPQGFTPSTIELVNPMPARPLIVVPYNAAWPTMYLVVALLVLDAIHLQVMTIDHVGSTSVPGLDAKPIIDIDVTVADPADEQAYVPRLEAAGFTLVMRQPSWHGARMLVGELPWAAGVNLHVFPAGCEEVARHKALRDWLAMPAGAEDRESEDDDQGSTGHDLVRDLAWWKCLLCHYKGRCTQWQMCPEETAIDSRAHAECLLADSFVTRNSEAGLRSTDVHAVHIGNEEKAGNSTQVGLKMK
ncbi:UPF0157 protein like [Verticillium longisporum]|uniref:UPF0157 protein like n=1 Tax=Verticillium longisporum TaxID=100787 RepID=A0A8I2Z729_VERLO|nr:UPF0157 protein like [Verticillium longisporum]